VVDFGGRFDGYFSDTTRNFVVGNPRDGYEEAFEVLLAAQKAACAAVRPHRTGHGIGLEVHEHPYIVEGNTIPLEPGMTFSIEPGIYIPGDFGLRIEDIVAVTADGIERLNQSSRSPYFVD
jgi:Xaa-Pro aminopeptidase